MCVKMTRCRLLMLITVRSPTCVWPRDRDRLLKRNRLPRNAIAAWEAEILTASGFNFRADNALQSRSHGPHLPAELGEELTLIRHRAAHLHVFKRS